ncbi:MAG: CsiV family protein [Gammaproteobacteria bacterium]
MMLRKPWTAVLILLLAVGATAQETTTPEYQVEVLVVRNLNPSTGTEVFPLNIEEEEPVETSEESTEIETTTITAETFLALDEGELTLTEMADKIRRSRNFRVVNHSGWTQPGFSRDDAVPKVFLTTASTGESVNGYIVLSRERYLRLALDLTMQIDEDQFQLNTQRRMISRQLHYFDNPYFGVIAKITPL